MVDLVAPTVQISINKPDYTIDVSKPFGKIDEHPLYRHWFVFGVRAAGSLVDIHDGIDDVMTNVPLRWAELIIQSRNDFINEMIRVLEKKGTPIGLSV